jgi:hypothetical protein
MPHHLGDYDLTFTFGWAISFRPWHSLNLKLLEINSTKTFEASIK